MLNKFMPQKARFFDFFEQHFDTTIEACQVFLEITTNGPNLEPRVARIKQLEHQADDIAHRCIDLLHRTYITPIDRNDIHSLIKRLDDIIDDIDCAATRLVLYELTEIRSEAKALAQILVRACTELGKAIRGLRNTQNFKEINEVCIRIHQCENEGDVAMRNALVRLFREEPSPFMIIKWKEIFEMLERATDSCEDVANIIEGIIIEAS